jgi:Glycosyltransferase WbsX
MVVEQKSISKDLNIQDETSRKARLIAFYLPQYHPIPENDEWWAKGFTEWTNVTKAKPLFPGHHQPNLPSDLGFYDLRVPETRIAQAELARKHGIEGFCYWHYWFGNGKRLLERPFLEVLESGQPDFPFCLGWANHTWSGIWDGCADRILVKQTYPGKDDYKAHFDNVLPAFSDDRYMKVKGKPIFTVFLPEEIPSSIEFTDYWRELAIQAGFPDMYFVGLSNNPNWNPKDWGFDAFTSHPPKEMTSRIPKSFTNKIFRKLFKKDIKIFLRDNFSIPEIYNYERLIKYAVSEIKHKSKFIPSVVPNWDNTPRSGANGIVFQNSTPDLFKIYLKNAIQEVEYKPSAERIVFIKSWNEWAEGNYLEPDRKFGTAYLEAIKSEVFL